MWVCSRSRALSKRLALSTSAMRLLKRSTRCPAGDCGQSPRGMPFVWGDFGGVSLCWMPSSAQSSAQSWSNSWLPEAARAREAKSLSVNSLSLAIVSRTDGVPMARSVSILVILIGQARCRSRRNLRAFAAILAGMMRTNTHLVARSMATKR
jgi:hypothetical protein